MSGSETLPKVVITQEGDGKTFAQPGDTISIHYVGTLESNGSEFDSSRKRGKPFSCTIGVGQVIKGWDIALTNNFGKGGIPSISKGTQARLTIPPEIGYGSRGFPGLIPANSTLVFDVELLNVNGK
ncbi:FK506 binding protein proline rotamase rapamycin-binding protein [Lodderomyces elongisporus]|uniref:peptidylprolyl isomerase n=1 Tax=Lodderomyces elongisporus (strain ATCC 11503 / CBS 2605 / JCM 1781 / NBRC 1676 / NRRL YB-4239) TaxID=379508 RepID=A5E669_LODEL|nr:FK506 binding protein proline rotamase rapamycin-binding protein [Lodderomyces elongisporus]EDK46927.1 FK506-binding protein [Lodderomyces elongisporus NRRL YB-4239]WLF81448.1 FK506 binding protein proline rotamase rapamycin-binding protein [Lodderomyces elongisporus]